MWKYNITDDMYSPELYHSADELYHYGVLGMRWRHRKRLKEYDRRYEEGANKILNSSRNMSEANKRLTKFTKKLDKEYADSINYKNKRSERIQKLKKAGKIIGGAALLAGGAYLAKKYIDHKKQERIRMTKNVQDSVKRIDNMINDSKKAVSNFTNDFIKKNPVSPSSNISGRKILKRSHSQYLRDYNNFFGVRSR